jgi:hypothetical protein
MTSTISSTSSDGWPAMAERARLRTTVGRLVAAWLLVIAAGAAPFAVTANEPTIPTGGDVRLAAPPDETCLPQATAAQGGFDLCSPPGVGTGGGGGGFNFGGLLPILAIVVAGAALAVVIAYLVLRRRAGPPLDPVDAGEWWTCRNCGRNNVVGSARCYACGTWQA